MNIQTHSKERCYIVGVTQGDVEIAVIGRDVEGTFVSDCQPQTSWQEVRLSLRVRRPPVEIHVVRTSLTVKRSTPDAVRVNPSRP